MKLIRPTFYRNVLVMILAISLFCNGFIRIALAAEITINLKYTVTNAEAYYVVTKGETPETLQVIAEGKVVSGDTSHVTFDDSDKIRIIYFVKPAEGYLLTGAGTTGKGNISDIHELKDPSKFKRTEAHVPQELITRLENEGYKLAWGYTRHSGNTRHLNDSVDGYQPKVGTSITHNADNIEVGQTLTMNIVVKPERPFRDQSDRRKYETAIAEGNTTVTIDGNKVIPVTDLAKINNNEYRGTLSYVITEDDVKVNEHTAVVNSKVDYTLDLSVNTGDYQGATTKTTTTVDAAPSTVNFSLVSSPERKLEYDFGYDGAPTIDSASHDSGSEVNVNAENYTRDGYEFVGWSYNDSLGNEVVLKPSDKFNMPDRVTGTRLKAVWKTELKVYNNNGEAVSTSSAIVGKPLSLIRPIRNGYIFKGWRGSDGKVYGTDFNMPDKPFQLVAMWEEIRKDTVKQEKPEVTPDKKELEEKSDKKELEEKSKDLLLSDSLYGRELLLSDSSDKEEVQQEEKLSELSDKAEAKQEELSESSDKDEAKQEEKLSKSSDKAEAKQEEKLSKSSDKAEAKQEEKLSKLLNKEKNSVKKEVKSSKIKKSEESVKQREDVKKEKTSVSSEKPEVKTKKENVLKESEKLKYDVHGEKVTASSEKPIDIPQTLKRNRTGDAFMDVLNDNSAAGLGRYSLVLPNASLAAGQGDILAHKYLAGGKTLPQTGEKDAALFYILGLLEVGLALMMYAVYRSLEKNL
ncbi:MAG: InlB B-repeat-containing protein [Catonella sp.]|uniref:InlB B-repeat-containing protein n=1 Tax=Catonella sp. TaxID=2382125 RepID=UPI003FA091D8